MSGYGEEWLEHTETTFRDMPICSCSCRHAQVDDPGMLEVYRKLMLIDLFQTEYGGWVSNLPLHIKVLVAVMLVLLLATVGVGIYFATVNWDRATNWMDETYQNLLEGLTPEEEEESHPKIKTIKQHNCDFESEG